MELDIYLSSTLPFFITIKRPETKRGLLIKEHELITNNYKYNISHLQHFIQWFSTISTDS
jgi:hypothetical protein